MQSRSKCNYAEQIFAQDPDKQEPAVSKSKIFNKNDNNTLTCTSWEKAFETEGIHMGETGYQSTNQYSWKLSAFPHLRCLRIIKKRFLTIIK
ncbi:MAG: hypothetical protein CSA26_07180 [Desulfobacterales bacterium]|nr:MAG: hypothetical protein CSA26_07180 [Desulfobacterales bacterium]